MKNAEAILALIAFILDYGAEAAVRLIKIWDIDEPTVEDILALKDRIRPPEAYLDDAGIKVDGGGD